MYNCLIKNNLQHAIKIQITIKFRKKCLRIFEVVFKTMTRTKKNIFKNI